MLTHTVHFHDTGFSCIIFKLKQIYISFHPKMQNKFAFHLLKSRVLTGNCLVAELYRLSLLTPNDFVDVSSSAFNKLLIDFSYFENRLAFDNFSGETEVLFGICTKLKTCYTRIRKATSWMRNSSPFIPLF